MMLVCNSDRTLQSYMLHREGTSPETFDKAFRKHNPHWFTLFQAKSRISFTIPKTWRSAAASLRHGSTMGRTAEHATECWHDDLDSFATRMQGVQTEDREGVICGVDARGQEQSEETERTPQRAHIVWQDDLEASLFHWDHISTALLDKMTYKPAQSYYDFLQAIDTPHKLLWAPRCQERRSGVITKSLYDLYTTWIASVHHDAFGKRSAYKLIGKMHQHLVQQGGSSTSFKEWLIAGGRVDAGGKYPGMPWSRHLENELLHELVPFLFEPIQQFIHSASDCVFIQPRVQPLLDCLWKTLNTMLVRFHSSWWVLYSLVEHGHIHAKSSAHHFPRIQSLDVSRVPHSTQKLTAVPILIYLCVQVIKLEAVLYELAHGIRTRNQEARTADLPAAWHHAWDASSQRHYWWNPQSRLQTYVLPPGVESAEAIADASDVQVPARTSANQVHAWVMAIDSNCSASRGGS